MLLWGYRLHQIIVQERDRIFLWVPVVFAAGILCYLTLTFEPSLWISAVVVETLIVLAYLGRYSSFKLAFLGWISIFVLGFINIQVRAYYLNTIPLLKTEKTLYLKGYVEQSGYNYRGKQYLILSHIQNFDNQSIKGKYRLTPLQMNNKIVVGDCVETVAIMRPLMLPTMENSYQFNRQQFFNGIKATGYTDVSVHKIPCQEIGVTADYFLPYIDKIRAKIVRQINSVLPPDTANIASAIIAGERGKISRQQTENYRDAGLAHFLAISGLHMGMIAGMMFLLVRWILAWFPVIALRYDSKKIAAVLAIIMSFIYLLISGWQISTQRAFIMTALVLLGVLVGRQAISMRMIAWAGFILLIIEPQVIISAGFQMSFAAVIMLVAFYEKFSGRFQEFKKEVRPSHKIIKILRWIIFYILGILIADFIASLATLPFVIYHFNRVSIYTSLANLLAGPIIGLWIMPMVLIVLLLMPLGLAKYPLIIVGKGIEIINQIAQWVSHLDYASWQVVSMPDWGLLLIVGGGLWLAVWNSSWRQWGWLFIIIGFLSILSVSKPLLVTDENAKTFALQDNDGNMIILPNRGNYFTKQMWREKLAISEVSQEKNNEFISVYQGRIKSSYFPLQCDKKSCLYQNRFRLFKKGGMLIDGKDYSSVAPLAVYREGTNLMIKSVRSILGKRYWNDVFQEK